MGKAAGRVVLARVMLVGVYDEERTWELGALEERLMQWAKISAQKRRTEPGPPSFKGNPGESLKFE